MSRTFAFKDLSLSSGKYRVNTTDVFSAPDVEMKAIQMARTDGTKRVFSRYLDRNLTVAGTIEGTSESDADTALDAIKAYMKLIDNLDVGYAGGTRRWVCEFTNLNITRDASDINIMGWTAKFYSPKPYGTDTTTATLVNQTVTSGSNSIGVTVAGSYPAQPLIQLTIGSISPSGPHKITVGNPTESSFISVTASFIAGDVLIIDCNPDTRSVKLNGAIVPSVGPFPAWPPKGGTLSLTDDATSRSIAALVTYPPRYI